MVREHGDFPEGYYFFHNPGMDRAPAESVKIHPLTSVTVEFLRAL